MALVLGRYTHANCVSLNKPMFPMVARKSISRAAKNNATKLLVVHYLVFGLLIKDQF